MSVISEVDLRHQIPAGLDYPKFINISQEIDYELQCLDKLYGRPIVRCGKLDFMIRAITPSVSKTGQISEKVVPESNMSVLKPTPTSVTPSSVKLVSSDTSSGGAIVVPRQKRKIETTTAKPFSKRVSKPTPGPALKKKKVSTSTSTTKKKSKRYAMSSHNSSPVKGPAAKFDVSDWPSDEEEAIDTSAGIFLTELMFWWTCF